MKRTEWMTCIVLGALTIYAVWNTAAVRYHLIRAETYRIELTEKIAAVAEENERLAREIAQSSDPAVMERMARVKLGLVMPGELIFRVNKPETRERE